MGAHHWRGSGGERDLKGVEGYRMGVPRLQPSRALGSVMSPRAGFGAEPRRKTNKVHSAAVYIRLNTGCNHFDDSEVHVQRSSDPVTVGTPFTCVLAAF